MAVLYLLMRQNAQRARLAEAEAARAETHFRIAADGAKVGVLEWRPAADEVQLSEQAARLLGAPNDTLGLREFLNSSSRRSLRRGRRIPPRAANWPARRALPRDARRRPGLDRSARRGC
jgi:PAS domain-containing protein